MAAISHDTPREIVLQVEESQRRARRAFRIKSGSMWVLLIGGLVFVLWFTHNIDTEWIGKWWQFILIGAPITVLLSVISILIATVLAILGAIGRISKNAYVSGVASLYVSLVRGTPLIAQILFIYLGLPQLGIVLDPIPAGIVALSFNYGAYMTEIFRAGIQAVPRGQREAAEALGMPEQLVMRRIVLPQAFRIVIPAIGNDFVAMIKDSALVSVISAQELLWRAEKAGTQTFHTLQAIVIAAGVYWILTIVFSYFQERLERRMARGDR